MAFPLGGPPGLSHGGQIALCSADF